MPATATDKTTVHRQQKDYDLEETKEPEVKNVSSQPSDRYQRKMSKSKSSNVAASKNLQVSTSKEPKDVKALIAQSVRGIDITQKQQVLQNI